MIFTREFPQLWLEEHMLSALYLMHRLTIYGEYLDNPSQPAPSRKFLSTHARKLLTWDMRFARIPSATTNA